MKSDHLADGKTVQSDHLANIRRHRIIYRVAINFILYVPTLSMATYTRSSVVESALEPQPKRSRASVLCPHCDQQISKSSHKSMTDVENRVLVLSQTALDLDLTMKKKPVSLSKVILQKAMAVILIQVSSESES